VRKKGEESGGIRGTRKRDGKWDWKRDEEEGRWAGKRDGNMEREVGRWTGKRDEKWHRYGRD